LFYTTENEEIKEIKEELYTASRGVALLEDFELLSGPRTRSRQ